MLALFLLALLTLSPAGTQDSRAQARVRAGITARDAGDLSVAAQHFEEALRLLPHDPEIIALRLSVEESEGERAMWGMRLLNSAADAKGRYKLERSARALVPKDEHAARIIKARTAAFSELMRAAKKVDVDDSVEDQVLARWRRRTALALAALQPGLLDGEQGTFPGFPGISASGLREVVDGLEHLASEANRLDDNALAMEANRLTRGLSAQARFKWLMETPADQELLGELLMKPGLKATNDLELGRERVRQAQRLWTVEELRRLTPEQQLRFTQEHETPGSFARAKSPEGLYQVESTCGYETLLGVAETVEHHHRRLVGAFGEDPFVGSPGVIRVVPEATDLEAEGARFFWVAGFQEGDVTTVRHSMSSLHALGETITHELAHRFDNRLHRGLPAWLLEGRAKWFETSFQSVTDREFRDRHAELGLLSSVWQRGYVYRGMLEQVIGETVTDYRRNYDVGYVLYLFLKTWRPLDEPSSGADAQVPVYLELLEEFVSNSHMTGQNRVAQFESWFCDGERGRAASLEAMTQDLTEFVEGFKYPGEKKPYPSWVTERYDIDRLTPTSWTDLVMDEPTWGWSPRRVEPYLGDGLALAAGELLAQHGEPAAAKRALLWALSGHGRAAGTEVALAELLASHGDEGAGWALLSDLDRASQPAPASVLKANSKLYGLLQVLKDASAAHQQRGWPESATSLLAEHNLLARRLGTPQLTVPDTAGEVHLDVVAYPAEGSAWQEGPLVGHHQPKQPLPGNWHVLPDGGVIVGSREPASSTGRFGAGVGAQVFVRGSRYVLPGTWRLATQIGFSGTSGSAVIALGWTRRDRAVLVSLSPIFAREPDSDAEPELFGLSWSIQGGLEREQKLFASRTGGWIDFEKPRSGMAVELLVCGSSCTLFVNGERCGTFADHQGDPIEGYVGFGTTRGVYRFSNSLIERLDRQAAVTEVPDLPTPVSIVGLEPWLAGDALGAFLSTLKGRRLEGAGCHAQGALVLRLPCSWFADSELKNFSLRKTKDALGGLADLMRKQHLTQAIEVVLPGHVGDALSIELRDVVHDLLRDSLNDLPGGSPSVHFCGCDGRVPSEAQGLPALVQPLIIFIDHRGIVRSGAVMGNAASLKLPAVVSAFSGRWTVPLESPEEGR